MGLLLHCHQCGTMFADASCPKCGSMAAPDEVYRQITIRGEFRRRRKRYEINQTISVGLIIVQTAMWGTLAALLSMRFWQAFKGHGPAFAQENLAGTILMPAMLGIACVLVTLIWIKAKEWWPVEVKCPGCETCLNNFAWAVVYCPGCGAYLFSRQGDTRALCRPTLAALQAREALGETRNA